MDLLCYDDLDEFGRELDDPLAELEQDLVHMLLESYGTNIDASSRSIGLQDYLSGSPSSTLKNFIEGKLNSDSRVDQSSVEIALTSTNWYKIDIKLVLNETELGISLLYDGSGNVVRQ